MHKGNGVANGTQVATQKLQRKDLSDLNHWKVSERIQHWFQEPNFNFAASIEHVQFCFLREEKVWDKKEVIQLVLFFWKMECLKNCTKRIEELQLRKDQNWNAPPFSKTKNFPEIRLQVYLQYKLFILTIMALEVVNRSSSLKVYHPF